MLAPASGTIITGNTQASRQLRRDFDAARRAQGHLVWDSPDILPCDAWLRRTWQESIWQECAWGDLAGTPVLLTRWQELTLWEEAIEATTRDVLLNSHATALAAADAWQMLHAWAAPDNSSFLESSGFEESEDTRAFFTWMSRVREQLLGRGWITIAELPGELRKRLAKGAFRLSGPFSIAGFDEIAPADRRLFDALGAQESVGATNPGRAARATCHDAMDELTRAAVWARRKLEANPQLRIGVVIPGLAAVAIITERIFDDILHPTWGFQRGQRPFQISVGTPLADVPVISAALVALSLVNGVPRDEAALIWCSPFVSIDPGEGARLELELLRQGVEYASLRIDSVKRRFPEMAAWAATLPARMPPSQWSAAFTRLLRLAGWPGPRTPSVEEHPALESWKDLLLELARLDSVLDFISSSGAISSVERMAAAKRLGTDDDNAPVQILDMSDATGSRFDALWIAGLHAGAWPRRAQPSPFLPLAMQRFAGMPRSSAERELAYAKRVTERLFASAPEIVCSFSANAEGHEERAAPFIADLPLLPEFAVADTVVRRVFASAPELEPRPAEGNLPLRAGTLQRGGTQVLADQSACPFRAFAVHRLQANEIDERDLGLSPIERGSIVHQALELLWKDLQTQAHLKARPFQDIEALIRSCVAAALGHYGAKREPSRAWNRFRKLEQARLEGLLRKWLDVESKRQPFTVIQSENARTVAISGLKLEIRVDRIDRYDDGTHAILDYKTSDGLSTSMWTGTRPEAPQLPLYATSSDEPISEVAFAQIATGSVMWEGLRGKALQEQLPRWDAVLKKLAGDFLNGRAEVDPDGAIRPCGRCHLHGLCRVKELGKQQPPGDDRDE
ncbi:MAG TPA: PD-(D/E)XK nuclease family protein [Bryobacteraceae bacterium]|nr:PD-(D/E)XK nuclease family protein [Bryobacteraceae bacterium]